MTKNPQGTTFIYEQDEKKELEELRKLLNESIDSINDYNELLAISVKLDEAILKYMRAEK